MISERNIKDAHQQLLQNNKLWVEQTMATDPQFFERLAKGQQPEYMWIGCSDSRIPADTITGTMPGDMFVHRNIANMVVHTDMNLLSVLSYAVDVLQVKHIIVCGHYGCGGVLSAMGNKQMGLIDNWLRKIKDVYRLHSEELEGIANETERGRRYVELNVVEQVYDLAKTAIVQNAWARGQELYLHGWVYDIADGVLKDLDVTYEDPRVLPNIYKFDK